MKGSYNSLINKITDEINNDLEYINMHELINSSGLSYFHFHRIFKAHVGESIKQYIKRRRLEYSAHQLNFFKRTITDVALEAGFATPSSYNKAFKDFFGVAPSKYKQTSILEKEYIMRTPIKVENVEEINVYFLRHNGDYLAINSKFEKLFEFAQKNDLLDKTTRVFGLYYDDPTVTDVEKLKSEACIENIKDLETTGDIEKKTIVGGKYAIFLYEGAYEDMMTAYEEIYSTYIHDNNIEVRNEPYFEHYLNCEEECESKDELRTHIYIPLA